MIDDTLGQVVAAQKERIKADIAEITKSKTIRNEGYHWVAHHLQVLVSDEDYDDDGQEPLPYDPDDPEDVERFAIELSLQKDGETPEKLQSSSPPKDSSGFHQDVLNCPCCSTFPPFSRSRRTRRFRLVEPWNCPKMGEKFDTCNHFMTISWCWAAFDKKQTCQIRDCTGPRRDLPRSSGSLKGKERDDNVYLTSEAGRIPPDEVLDRAVEYASSEGLRCIWIDRSCLPQDMSRIHQVGIQSMDLVYQRAACTAGILETTIRDQAILNSLSIMLAWAETGFTFGENPGQDWWDLHCAPGIDFQDRRTWGIADLHAPRKAQEMMAREACSDVLNLLEDLANDRWYTRAWIIQESISAGTKLTLLLRVSAGLGFIPSPFVRQIGSLLKSDMSVQQAFVLSYNGLRKLITGLEQMIRAFFDMQEPDMASAGHPLSLSGREHELLIKARKVLDPGEVHRRHPAHKRCGIINCGCRTHFTCNAASAITLLQNRSCFKAEDKVAIVANLCNYEIRLSTFELSKNFKFLRPCLIALAIINGDLSLFALENYDMDISSFSSSPASLLEIPLKHLHSLNKIDVEPSSSAQLRTANTHFALPSGAVLPAYIWHVKHEIDFSPIQAKWANAWWDMKALQIVIIRFPQESKKDLAERTRLTNEKLHRSNRAEMFRIREQLKKAEGEIGGHYTDADFSGVKFSMSSSSSLIEGSEEVGEQFGRMVVDILSYLYYTDEKSLANSIWQSLRVPLVESIPLQDGLFPDKLDDSFFDHPIIRGSPQRAFQVDATRDGALAQQWLFDRIIVQGKLWTGHYVPSNTAGSGLTTFQPLRVVSNNLEGPKRTYEHRGSSKQPAHFHHHTLEIVRDLTQQGGISSHRSSPKDIQGTFLGPWVAEPHLSKNSSLIGRDMVKSFLGLRFIQQAHSPEVIARYHQVSAAKIEALFGLSTSSQAMMHYMDTYVGWDIEKQDDECVPRVSAFDVDGPCLVATPFDPARERLTRTQERTMSAAWVVESLGDMEIDELDAKWVRREFVGLRRHVLSGDDISPYEDISELEERNVPDHVTEEMKALKLKVLTTVKGVWELIDPIPFQSYIFT